MSQMLKSSGAIGAATLASRVLGMVREMAFASFMGAGPVAAAFFLAFMIPNLFRRLLGEGALTAAFIPLFKEKERTEGEAAMWRSANAVISGLVLTSGVIIAVVTIGITVFLHWGEELPGASKIDAILQVQSGETEQVADIRPGDAWLDPATDLMLRLARLMFPYMLLVCLAAMFMGMLNARGHFFLPAMGSAVLNGILIVTVVLIAPRYGTLLEQQIFVVAIAVLVAGVMQAVYQMPLLRKEGFRYSWENPWGNDTVRLIVERMIPGMMGVAAFQFNLLVTNGIAWAVDKEIVASFGYAVRLMELPQGVFGLSLATYLLPTLAGLAADKKYPQFRETLRDAVGYLVLANLLASVLLIVLAEPIIRLLFERGRFDAQDTRQAGFALACLAPGLVAFSLVNIFARAFYALGDTKTPMRISAFCLVLNVLLVAWLIYPFREGGLGIANSLTACLNAGLLSYGLRRKLKTLDFARLWRPLASMAGAVVIAGELAWLAHRMWARQFGADGLGTRLGAVFVPMLIAGLAYVGLLLWLRVPQAQDYWRMIRQRLGGR